MDVFNYVIHNHEWKREIENLPEMTRQAFVELLSTNDTQARLIANWLVERCRWSDMTECNDGIMEAKQNSLRNIIIGAINECNKEPVILEDNEEA